MKYDYYITGVIGEEYDWWTGERGTTASMVKEFLDEHKGKRSISWSAHPVACWTRALPSVSTSPSTASATCTSWV